MLLNSWVFLFYISICYFTCSGDRKRIKPAQPYYNRTIILKPLGSWNSDAIKSSLMGVVSSELFGEAVFPKLYFDRRYINFTGSSSVNLCYNLPEYSPRSPKVENVIALSQDPTLIRTGFKIITGRTGDILNEDLRSTVEQLSRETDVPYQTLEQQQLIPLVVPSQSKDCDFQIAITTSRDQRTASIIVVASVSDKDKQGIHKWALLGANTLEDNVVRAYYFYKQGDECRDMDPIVPVLLKHRGSLPATTTVRFTTLPGQLLQYTKDVPLPVTDEEMKQFYCSVYDMADTLRPVEINEDLVLEKDVTLFYWNLSRVQNLTSLALNLERTHEPKLYADEVKGKGEKIVWALDEFKRECACNRSIGSFDDMADCVRNSPVDCVLYANAKVPISVDRRDICLKQNIVLIYLDKHLIPPKYVKLTKWNVFEAEGQLTSIDPILAEMEGLNHSHQCDLLQTKSLSRTTVANSSHAIGLTMSIFKGVYVSGANIVVTAEAIIRRDELIADKPIPTDMSVAGIFFSYNSSSVNSLECPDLEHNGLSIPEVLAAAESHMESVPAGCEGSVVASLIIRPKSGLKCHVDSKYEDPSVQYPSRYDFIFQLAEEYYYSYENVHMSLIHIEIEEQDCTEYALYELDPINTTLYYDLVPADVCNHEIPASSKIGSGTLNNGIFAPNQYYIAHNKRRLALILYSSNGDRCIKRSSRDGGALLELSYPFSGSLNITEDLNYDENHYLWVL